MGPRRPCNEHHHHQDSELRIEGDSDRDQHANNVLPSPRRSQLHQCRQLLTAAADTQKFEKVWHHDALSTAKINQSLQFKGDLDKLKWKDAGIDFKYFLGYRWRILRSARRQWWRLRWENSYIPTLLDTSSSNFIASRFFIHSNMKLKKWTI